jgi:subfamily B ATP-binding cassette protein MsbA
MSASTLRNSLYGRLLGHVFPHWRILLVSFASTAVLAATEPAMPALLKILLDGSFVERDDTLVTLMPLAIVGLFLVRGLAGFVSNYSTGWVGSRLVTDLREMMFRRLMRVPMAFFDEHASGLVLSRFTYDVNQVTKAATNAWVTVIRDSLAVLGLLGWMFWLSWELTLFTLLIVPPIGLAIRIASRRLRRLNRASQQQMGGLNHVIREVLGAQREIRLFGAEDYENHRFNARANRVRQMYNKTIATTAASVPIVQLFIAAALAALVYFAMLQTGDEAFTVGAFVSYFGAMAMLFAPMKRLTKVNDDIQRGLAAAESVFFIADQPVETDPPDAEPLGPVRGDIRFEHVSFRYPGQAEDALEEVDLHIPAGTTVALVGASGSGKTTLASLIPLFLRPRSGRVLLDGRDITTLALSDLRAQIALVSQQVVLFDDTVAANIAYGRQEELDRTRLEEAAAMAHASEFIEHLSAGMETGVGENGAQLSGGQRQRLAIARALVKDAPILILDEATSALDTHAERRIQAAIETVSRGRTSVVIAHRLSTIENADLIVVLDRGRVVETGTHAELLARDGHYAALHRAQTSGEREAVA